MRICVILEGCYPYVTGGVSSWMHQYIKAMPEHEFVVLAIGADPSIKGKFKYELPDNVVEIREIFLTGEDHVTKKKRRRHALKLTEEEKGALYELIRCGSPDWDVLFSMLCDKGITPVEILTCKDFQELLTDVSRKFFRHMAFSEIFHTIRSMLIPLFKIMQTDMPKADVYHAIATGYAGVLARLGSYSAHAPFLITEHGLYTREREEEILRANWVVPDCRTIWIEFFYMLAQMAYSGAEIVTCLFDRAMRTQIEMGCEEKKCRVVANGIHYDVFSGTPPREVEGDVHIAAILRIAPIKDVKTLLYAFAEMKNRFPGAKLFIAGPEDDPDYAEECHGLIRRLQVQDVIFMGTIMVADHMKDFDFTVLSSISEGQPLSVLESFAAGRPCVTTDVGCCKELLNGSGEDKEGIAGLCVPPMQPHALSLAMEEMCRNKEMRVEMGKVGKRRARLYFQHNDMIRKYQEVYDEVFQSWQG